MRTVYLFNRMLFSYGFLVLAALWFYRKRTKGRLLFLIGWALYSVSLLWPHIPDNPMFMFGKAGLFIPYQIKRISTLDGAIGLLGLLVAFIGFALIVLREENGSKRNVASCDIPQHQSGLD
ncbi:MAG: hypothetical protein QG656_2289 [Candidatus Hydrogenedentes bacterium]|nr:hypothetical protein [Candidatus Hydrogenedentota bacterium]